MTRKCEVSYQEKSTSSKVQFISWASCLVSKELILHDAPQQGEVSKYLNQRILLLLRRNGDSKVGANFRPICQRVSCVKLAVCEISGHVLSVRVTR